MEENKKQIVISPSLLSADFLDLKSEIAKFEETPNLNLHLDIMDGHFVPNLTFGPTVVRNLHQVTNIPLDAHLMVENPTKVAPWFKDLGLFNITLHVESLENPIEDMKKLKKNFDSVGLSLKPATDVSIMTPEILTSIDRVLLMSVEPGFGGQSFKEEVLEKAYVLSKIRKEKGINFCLQIDGGINPKTAKLSIEAGVDNLVAGSYIFKSKNYTEAIDSLR